MTLNGSEILLVFGQFCPLLFLTYSFLQIHLQEASLIYRCLLSCVAAQEEACADVCVSERNKTAICTHCIALLIISVSMLQRKMTAEEWKRNKQKERGEEKAEGKGCCKGTFLEHMNAYAYVAFHQQPITN